MNKSPNMQKESIKTIVTLKVLTIVFLFSINSFAQNSPTQLVLNNPLNAEIKGGEKDVYSVTLATDQTAQIEAVQDGIDINFEAFDVQGKPFIISLSPSGLYGDDSILVTAKEAGEYKVEVSPASPRSKLGKYRIVLKEIRPTVAEDFQINEASAKILQLAQEATQLKYNGTIEGLQDAIAKWDEAIEVSKIKKDKVWEGVAIVAQGLIYKQLGEFQNALDSYLKSLVIWRELGNRQYEGSAVNNIGNGYADLGEYEKALPYFQQSASINREVGDRNSLGFSLNNLAAMYQRLGNYDESEKYYRDALVIRREIDTVRGKRSLANTLKNLGYTLFLKGELENSFEFIQESLEMRREIDYQWGIADSLLMLGKIKAENSFENLSKANRISVEVGDRRLQAESFYLLAEAEKDRGNLDKATENITKGLEIIEEIRSEIVSSQSRYAYFSTVQGYYEFYTDLLISQAGKTTNRENITFALEMSERSRSRSLVELLQEARVDFRQGIQPKLLAEQKNLQKQINDKYTRRQSLLSRKSTSEQITKINNEINDLNTRIQQLNLQIRRENPKLADLTEGKTISAKEIQNLLDDKTVLLEYKLGKDRSFVWLVTKGSVEVFELPKRETIEAKTRTFYEAVVANKRADRENFSAMSKELSKTLLGSFADKVENKRLAIVAEGILQYLPFSALQDSAGNYLADKNEIIVLPSASVLAQIRKNSADSAQNKKTLAVFADPVFDKQDSRIAKNTANKPDEKSTALKRVLRDFRFGEDLPRLLASRQEAQNISELIPNSSQTVQLGFEANLGNIENTNLADYKIIHFATHGLLNTKQPELSGLVFSLYDEKGNSQDGFLSLNDIYNLNLNADMVVLSACQTALGKEVRGEGLIGISRGFLYAGSNRIVASLWKVDDSATAEFMKRFYSNHLQNGMPASKALQQTKIEMKKIKRYESPYYWSAFTLLGDWK